MCLAFNGDLAKWDVSRVTDMYLMFWDASSFNGDLAKWDVSGVSDMSRVFWGAISFNGDLAQVTASQRQRAEETVDILESWADGAGRLDKVEEEWDDLREAVENPNLRDFKILLEKEVITHTRMRTQTSLMH